MVVKKDHSDSHSLTEHDGSHAVELRSHHDSEDSYDNLHDRPEEHANHEYLNNQVNHRSNMDDHVSDLNRRRHNSHQEHGDYSNDVDHLVELRGHTGHHSHWEHGDDKRQEPDDHIDVVKLLHDDHGINIHNDWIKRKHHGYFDYDDRELHEKATGYKHGEPHIYESSHNDYPQHEPEKKIHHESEGEHTLQLQHDGGTVQHDEFADGYDHKTNRLQITLRHGHDYAKKEHHRSEYSHEHERRDHHNEPEHEHHQVRDPEKSFPPSENAGSNHSHVEEAVHDDKRQNMGSEDKPDDQIMSHHGEINHDHEDADHVMQREHHFEADHHNGDLIEKKHKAEVHEYQYKEKHLPDKVHNIPHDHHSDGTKRNHAYETDYIGERQHHGLDDRRGVDEVLDEDSREHHDNSARYDIEDRHHADDHEKRHHHDNEHGKQFFDHSMKHHALEDELRNHDEIDKRHEHDKDHNIVDATADNYHKKDHIDDWINYPNTDDGEMKKDEEDKRDHHDGDHHIDGDDKREHHEEYHHSHDDQRMQHDNVVGHHDVNDVRREYHSRDYTEDSGSHVLEHKGSVEERAHPEDDNLALEGDTHSEGHHPKRYEDTYRHEPAHDPDETEPYHNIGETSGFHHEHYEQRGVKHQLIEQHER